MRHVAMALAAALTACASPGTPVPMAGTPTEIATLAGEWSGQYSSVETGRSGSIVFRLTAGTDSATGDVMMSAMTGGPRPDDVMTGSALTPPQVIAIRFVSIEGGRVSGRLAPYTEPTCNCQLITVFEGRLNGSTLSGTYTSRTPDGRIQNGRWEVTRRSS